MHTTTAATVIGVRVVRGCKDGERRYDWGKWI